MIRHILNLTRGFRVRIAVSAGAGIARVLTALVFVALSKRIVDIAVGAASGSLTACVAGLAGAILLELICTSAVNRTSELSEAEMKNTLQERIFSHMLAAEWTGREKYHTGDILSRLTDDCRVAAECLCRTVPTAIVACFQLAGAFLFLWYFSPALAVILFLLLPVFTLAGRIFYRRVRILTRRIRGIESRLHQQMQESLQHRILLLTCRQSLRAVEAVRVLHRSRLRMIRRRTDLTTYSRTAVLAGFESGYLAAFLWGIAGLRSGAITFGTLTAYLQLAGQIQRPIADLARLLPAMIQSHTAFSRLSDIEMLPVEDESGNQQTIDNPAQAPMGIELRNVTFSYPAAVKPVLSHFSHTFAPGSRTAIVGETGAGKSTLLRLIVALLRPQEGRITLFSTDSAQTTWETASTSTRSQIVYVPQGNSLLSGTIRDNLRLAKPDATDEEMRSALHAAAADFVHDLKDGLDTRCGEHGTGLSEGQAQRIAIARGLLRPGSILLLDEISSSLDEATERLLMQRLTEQPGAHTILLVTHRKSSLPYCDSILRVDSPII